MTLVKLPPAPPPPENWELFEDICADIFSEEWKDPYALRFGRQGQRQFGVDIVGSPSHGGYAAVQCKWTNSAIRGRDLDEAVSKAKAFKKTFKKWRLRTLVIAATAKNDKTLVAHAQDLSRRLRRQHFRVIYLPWPELWRRLLRYPRLVKKYCQDPRLAALAKLVRGVPQKTVDLLDRQLYGGPGWDSTSDALPAIARAVVKSLETDAQTTLHFIGAGMMQYWGGLERTFLRSWQQDKRLTLHISMADTDAPALRPLRERWSKRRAAYRLGLKLLMDHYPDRKLTVRYRYYRDRPIMMGVLINGRTLFLERYELRGDEKGFELTRIYNASRHKLCVLYERGKGRGTAVIRRFLAEHRKGIPRPEEDVNQPARS